MPQKTPWCQGFRIRPPCIFAFPCTGGVPCSQDALSVFVPTATAAPRELAPVGPRLGAQWAALAPLLGQRELFAEASVLQLGFTPEELKSGRGGGGWGVGGVLGGEGGRNACSGLKGWMYSRCGVGPLGVLGGVGALQFWRGGRIGCTPGVPAFFFGGGGGRSPFSGLKGSAGGYLGGQFANATGASGRGAFGRAGRLGLRRRQGAAGGAPLGAARAARPRRGGAGLQSGPGGLGGGGKRREAEGSGGPPPVSARSVWLPVA